MKMTCFIIKLLYRMAAFAGGFALGQLFYYFFLTEIPFPGRSGIRLGLFLSVFLGFFNVLSKQFRCIFVLVLPMYFGKPGRGVLKAMILTYIVTGPITNMGLNAKEVVRVFACSSQLSRNLSLEKYCLRRGPVLAATRGIVDQVEDMKLAFSAIEDVIEPIEQEIEDVSETKHIQYDIDVLDDFFGHKHRSDAIEAKFQKTIFPNGSTDYEMLYRKKLRYRCEDQLSRAAAVCVQRFKQGYAECCDAIAQYSERGVCWPLVQKEVCDVMAELAERATFKPVCEAPHDGGLGQKIVTMKRVKTEFVENVKNISLEIQLKPENETLIGQHANETGESIEQAFEEKTVVMRHVVTIMNICIALLFLRIFHAAMKYHELYLTCIDYDNVYITDYFKKLDAKRRNAHKYTLLPLKKMERYRYIDVYSLSYKESQRSNLMLHILKVMLEVVTATTFVMLDRLFYEALEVVRQHAEMDVQQQGTRDFDIHVEGTGMLAAMLRNYLVNLNSPQQGHKMSNVACLPHPRQMPYIYFLKIYGGYTWIVMLLFANPYTMRLKRLICSHFYPERERERILHLYNDILKKRLKMHKTLRRKAVQAVRAHYLSGDVVSLFGMRMKFPRLLGWLRALPAARMACLICGETEPSDTQLHHQNRWHSCLTDRCPFLYCGDCWREVGARCLACEPSLVELSDVDSHSDDERHRY